MVPQTEQPGNTDILARIHKLEPSFSKTQRRIAKAILSYPRYFVEKPIEELAPWIGVSAPTITRFCRRVGCDGLRDLKLQVMGAMRVGARYFTTSEPPTTMAALREQTANRAQNAIIEAMQISDEVLHKAIDAILSARIIYAFGSGGVSNWLVEEVQNRFFRLGKTVVPCRDGVMQAMLASTIEPETLVLCCSLGGSNRSELDAIRIAQEYGAYCMALCPGGTEMERLADLTLPVETHDQGDVLGPTPARYAMLYAIDLLAFGAAIRSRDTVSESLRRLKHQFVGNVDPDILRPLAD